VADRYLLVPITSSDPNSGFKITVHLEVEYLLSCDKLIIER